MIRRIGGKVVGQTHDLMINARGPFLDTLLENTHGILKIVETLSAKTGVWVNPKKTKRYK